MKKDGIMKKGIRVLAAAALFLAGCGKPVSPEEKPDAFLEETPEAEAKDTKTVILLTTNDVHCGLTQRIGYDGLYLYKEELCQTYENVLLVDAGDAIQGGVYGTLSYGEIIIDLMNDVGYDVATVGNHEFDYGFEVLDDLSEKLKCGYTCANFCTADGEPVFEPYRIIEAGGRKIAFVGVDTPSTFTKSKISRIVDDQGVPLYDFLADDTGEKLAACVQKYVDEVREKGADTVVLLSHLGTGEAVDERFSSETVMKKTTGIDLLIDGHSHTRIVTEVENRDGKKIPAIQAGAKLESIGKVMINPDHTITTELVSEIPEPVGIQAELVTRGKREYWVDSGIKKKIGEYTDAYDSFLNRKIGEISYDIPFLIDEKIALAKTGENGMLNLYTDALREAGESEIGMCLAGGARSGLNAGDIRYGDTVQALPYSDDVIVVSLKGQDLLDALEFGARRLPGENNGLIHVSGMEYTVDLSVPSSVKEDDSGVFVSVDGPYRVRDVLVDGKPLDPKRTYTVTMNTFIFGGGDGMAMMKNAELLRFTQKVENTVLADYIEQTLGGKVPERYAAAEGRIRQIGG